MDRRNDQFRLYLLLTAQRLRDLQLLDQPLSLGFAVDQTCYVWHGNPFGGEIVTSRLPEAEAAFPVLSFTGAGFDRWLAADTPLEQLFEDKSVHLVNGDKLPRRLNPVYFLELLEADRMTELKDSSLSFDTMGLKLHRLAVAPDNHLTFNNPKLGTLLLPLGHDVAVRWLHFPSPMDEFVDVTGPEVRPVRHEKTAQSLRLYRLPQGLLELASETPGEVLLFDLA